MNEVEQLKQVVLSSDWEAVKAACARLSVIGGDDVVLFLIGLLQLDNPGVRNQAALALRDMGDNRAVEPLLLSIRRPENYNYNGTMVYALEALKCGRYLKQIFDVLFFETYEAKISADVILNEQEFEFDKEDVFWIQDKWNECKQNPALCPDYNEWYEDIEDHVQGFVAYLEPEK